MVYLMSRHISAVLAQHYIINKEDQEIYTYGIQLIIMSLLGTSSIILLGILFGKLGITFIFIIVIISIRSYSGGYHANRYWECYMISCLSYLGLIVVSNIVPITAKPIVTIVLLAISYLGIYFMAPLNSANNPKTNQEMEKRRNKTRIFITLYSLIALIALTRSQGVEVSLVIAYTQFIVTISIGIAKIKGGITNEGKRNCIKRNC